jgi:hypothetical protein
VNIDNVIADSGAEGVLEVGDRLVSIDEIEISNADDLRSAIGDRAVGDSIAVTVLREGDEVTATIVLGANPDAPERPLLGVMIETAFDRVTPDQLTTEPTGGPLSRAVAVGADLFVFSPETGSWGSLGVEAPAEQWAATGRHVLSIENPSTPDSALIDAIGGDRLVFEVDGWQGARILGTLGDAVAVSATRPVEGREGFVEIALLLIDFGGRAAEWVWPADPEVGRPVLAYPSPDGSRLLVVNQALDETLRHVVLSSEGQVSTSNEDLAAGNGMLALGWFDDQTALMRESNGDLQLLDISSGVLAPLELPASVGTPLRVWPVGDGTNLLATTDNNLIEMNVVVASEVRTLADHCLIEGMGEIGWGA